jgi:hypothetical protein
VYLDARSVREQMCWRWRKSRCRIREREELKMKRKGDGPENKRNSVVIESAVGSEEVTFHRNICSR